jgi:hypothetical protein
VANRSFPIFLLLLHAPSDDPRLLADRPVVSAFADLTKSLGGWSLVANALLLGSP